MKKFLLCLTLVSSAVCAERDARLDFGAEVYQELQAEGHITQLQLNQKLTYIKNMQVREQMALSQEARSNELKSGPAGTASISGNISLSGIGQLDVGVSLWDYQTRNNVGFVFTDAAGDYTFTGLAAGDYYVTVSDYYDQYINVIWSAFGTEDCISFCQPDGDNEINLAAATNFVNVDLTLTVGATLSGNVADGLNPVEGTYVLVRDTDYNYSVGVPTDASGNYTANGLPAGEYYVLAQDATDIYIDAIWSNSGTEECFNCIPDVDNVNVLMPAQNLGGINLTLTVGATLSGQIVDAVTNAAVETLRVNLYDPANINFNGNVFTQFDGAGNYTVTGIPQGSYKVYLDPDFIEENSYIPEIYNDIQCNLCSVALFNGAGADVVLTNGATTAGIDFQLDTGASISGAILDAGSLPNTLSERALVYIFDASNRVVAIRFLLGTNYDPTFNGSYRIGGLLPGTYFAQGGDLGTEFFQRELYNNIRCPWSGCDRGAGGTPINLGPNENRLSIDFLLERGGKISGTVTDAASGNPIDTSTETHYVQFYDSSGAVAGGAAIRPDGTYVSQRALPPGTYSVRTGSMFNGAFIAPYVMQKYDPMGNIDCPGLTCDLTSGNVTVTANNTETGIDFALSSGESFSGTITEVGSATVIPDVHVLVYDNNGNFANWATTDAAGNFTVDGLPAGTYYALTNNGSNLPFLGIRAAEVGTWVDVLFDGLACPGSICDVTTGTPIVLGGAPFTQAGVQTIEFNLETGGTITGQVNTFGSDLPASFAAVNVFDSQGQFFGSYQADENGFYLTAGLPDGTYYLTTQSNGGLVDVSYGNQYCFDGACDPLQSTPVVISNGQSLVEVDFELRSDYVFKNSLE
ncbi:carboxypeptidase-like regulatory domain-containing protein [Marinicella sp. S1101]|uniref:carboxypeptidase-like regulatory domain-containing protein n=1 Tax=Marinicella marina TaxID=2996016 RepID=UPI002260B990|nr:carboxypeptidase-like regulatory domain-containing protein [Marinicella marina]MCX7552999.1 carboxypeptidase-like regulatory domain-containing protein [Marinicella marina]MDJ1139691.1 carboxypeptidase-like regulatory domain-containing protein [Marinicella marina]